MRDKRSWRPKAGLLKAALLCGVLVTPLALAQTSGGVGGGQTLGALFPEGVPGYGTDPGVTVRSRARPATDPSGIRFGPTLLRPDLTVSIGYDDNVFGGPNHRGSPRIVTSPSLLAATAWADTSLGLFLSADDTRYPQQPSQDRTAGTAVLGGTLGFGRDTLTLGVGHVSGYQDRTELDALPSDRPIAYQVDDLRAAYALALGRLTVTQAAEISRWRYQNTTISGVPVSQSNRDRATVLGGLTLRYAWMPAREVVFVTRLLDTRYLHPARGTPSNDSTSYQALFGIDYDDNAVWRYRLLGGLQYRAPAAAAYRARTEAITEAEVVWSPSGMTTARATLTRGIEDAAQTGLSSYTYTSARLTVDHELLRNVLLNASFTLRHADFEQTGGRQTAVAFGGGATWLLNRRLRLSLSYDFADIRNTHLPARTVAGDYTRNLIILSLRTSL